MQQSIETYEQAIHYLFSRINYERLHGELYTVGDFKLDRMARLLSLLGDPHERLPVVHVAGSKGKGSTAAMIAAMLGAAGRRVGLFTSPHIDAFEERMTVDGISPSPAELVELLNPVANAVTAMGGEPGHLSPTYFELATALAWRYFDERAVDVAVIEVGLGGRLDATNVCRPTVSVITSISRDHTRLLGGELSEIAREKGGIIRPGVPVVSGAEPAEARRAIEVICREHGTSSLCQLGREINCTGHDGPAGSPRRVDVETPSGAWPGLPVPLRGAHQARNVAVAVAVIDRLRQVGWSVSRSSVDRGLAGLCWPLRIEVLARRPTVVVDTAHNWASIAALLETLEADFPARRRLLVFGTSRDKDTFDTIILTQYLDNPRAVPAEALQRIAGDTFDTAVHTAADPVAAWKLARHLAGPDDLVCVTGSFFIAAEMRELIVEPADSDKKPEIRIRIS